MITILQIIVMNVSLRPERIPFVFIPYKAKITF